MNFINKLLSKLYNLTEKKPKVIDTGDIIVKEGKHYKSNYIGRFSPVSEEDYDELCKESADDINENFIKFQAWLNENDPTLAYRFMESYNISYERYESIIKCGYLSYPWDIYGRIINSPEEFDAVNIYIKFCINNLIEIDSKFRELAKPSARRAYYENLIYERKQGQDNEQN